MAERVMPSVKITVSVPADVWVDALRALPDTRPSHVVARALVEMVARLTDQ